MPSGTSTLFYPTSQPAPQAPLVVDDSYFLIRLHDTQTVFEGGLLARPGFVTLSSEIDSSFQQGGPTKSLFKVAAIERGFPCRPGVRPNLTDWLPARVTDTLRISLAFMVTLDSPFNNLLNELNRIDLSTQLSLLGPQAAVAFKVSEVAGRMLDFLSGAGTQREQFALTIDLNVATMRAGYWVVFGSPNNKQWPPLEQLGIDASGRLVDPTGYLDQLSYAVFEVCVLPKRGSAGLGDTTWGELLNLGESRAQDPLIAIDPDARDKALSEWHATLRQTRELANKDRAFLRSEITQIILDTHTRVQNFLAGRKPEATLGDDTLPQVWQEVLGVESESQIDSAVRAYRQALEEAQRLKASYGLART